MSRPNNLLALALCASAIVPLGAQPQARAVTDSSRASDSAAVRAALAPRVLRAVRLVGLPPIIDGRLDDMAWTGVPIATDFIQIQPEPAALARWRTEVRITYDAEMLYVGARLYDPHPDSIVRQLSRKDDDFPSDWVFIEFDSRHDRRTMFGMGTTAGGSQQDYTFFNDGASYDFAWNAVWESSVHHDSLGWSAEFRIPFSQFPRAARAATDSSEEVWGFNIMRMVARSGEVSNWSVRLPANATRFISSFNELRGLDAAFSFDRLELLPYAGIGYGGKAGLTARPELSTTGGLDARYKLAPSVSLSATLHPDFRQVEADPSEINLTTFATFFTEQRPFFVEGADFFRFDTNLPLYTRDNDFSSELAFYSRRIGKPPLLGAPLGATAVEMPPSSTLLAALKLAGRTAGGWSLGALTAVTDRARARYVDADGVPQSAEVEPLTNFGVFRMWRDSRAGASSVGLIGTLVHRLSVNQAVDRAAVRSALSAGVDGRHRFGDGAYEVRGFWLTSAIGGSAAAVANVTHRPAHLFQRPDAPEGRDDPTRTTLEGFASQLRLSKITGRWQWSVAGHAISPGFETNDIGFQRNADWLLAFASVRYGHFQPGRFFRQWSVGSKQIAGGWTFDGERRASAANAFVSADLNNFWRVSVNVDHDFPALSMEALRGGPALLVPARTNLSLVAHSDSRRRTRFTFGTGAYHEPALGSSAVSVSLSAKWQATGRLALSAEPNVTRAISPWQYVATIPALGGNRYVLGRLTQQTLPVTARASLGLSSTSSVLLYVQPFIGAGQFNDFKEVIAPRAASVSRRVRPFSDSDLRYDPSTHQYSVLDAGVTEGSFADPSFNRRDFNANAVWRWEFRPGSTLYVVWTQQRSGTLADGTFAPRRDFGSLLTVRPENSVLLKMSYWLPV